MGFQGLGAIRGWAQAWLASASEGREKARDVQQASPAAEGGMSSCFELQAVLAIEAGLRPGSTCLLAALLAWQAEGQSSQAIQSGNPQDTAAGG